MLTKPLLMLYVAGLMTLGECVMTTPDGATSREAQAVCRELSVKLPTRSRSDTNQTQKEIGELYAAFEAICPGFELP
ncbi:hypothetical protein [Dinoroseobacter sp. S124A]|uniref:hypothetical protein n=1 Tax=Dinoroseobacter sp. S124A TaxID=3415128 RepID=UPI003C7A0244